MKKLPYIVLVFFVLFSTSLFSQGQQKQPVLHKQFYYLNNSSPYPEEVITALFRVFDNKNFDEERSKMTPAQANLILWNAVANITTYTNPLNQLNRYKAHQDEIINIYNQMGYSSENQECIRMLFKSAAEADSLKMNQYTWTSPNCFYSNSYDSLVVRYIDKNLNELVRDENGEPIDKKYTGEYRFYDKSNYGYVRLYMHKGHKVTAERYNQDLKLQKLEWFYPSGSLRFQLVFTEGGNKSYETYFYPYTESTKREIVYNEDEVFSSIVDYDESGNVLEEKYYSPSGKIELSYGIVKLKDGTSVYAPIEAYNPEGKSTYNKGNGVVEIYTYEKTDRKLLMRQEFKDYRLEGKVLELDPQKGKIEKQFESGELTHMLEYYNTGDLKRETTFENGDVSKVTSYPKYKNYKVSIENVSPEETWYGIQNTESMEETKLDTDFNCSNCKEILADIFSKQWVNNNPELFEKEFYEYNLAFKVSPTKEVYDVSIYEVNDYKIANEEAFQAEVLKKVSTAKIDKLPKLEANQALTMNTNYRIKVINIP